MTHSPGSFLVFSWFCFVFYVLFMFFFLFLFLAAFSTLVIFHRELVKAPTKDPRYNPQQTQSLPLSKYKFYGDEPCGNLV